MKRAGAGFALIAAAALGLTASSCKVGCVGGESGCAVEVPCKKVKLSCDASSASALKVFRMSSPSQRPSGVDALGAVGDVVLQNAFTTVVISDIDNQNYVDIAGGSILDLAATGGADGITEILPAVGLLPRDEAHFTSIELHDESPDRVWVQVKGALEGHPEQPIYTRYELTPCDQGVRVRTEVLNGSPDNAFWALCDGWYWSKREPIPFTAGKGQGFTHPSFGLSTLNDAYQSYPFLAASQHNGESAAYATVSCTDDTVDGFNSETISTSGLKKALVPPRGWLAYERYLAVAAGRDVESAARIALQVREQVVGEKHVKITGKIERPMALALGTEATGDVVLAEGKMSDAPEQRTPWTQVVPDKTGAFTATVPAGKSWVLSVSAFGRTVIDKPLDAVSADTDVGTLTLPSVGTVRFSVNELGGGSPLDAEIFLAPADDATRDAVAGTLHGEFGKCTPWLGAPAGASPACNRVLVRQGVATAEVPAGKFDVFAFHGPFWSLGHQVATIVPGMQSLTFLVARLPLQPPGTVSADLHVHGGASFDSMIPDYDRVLAFAASDLDVIVATDHDVVYDYSATIAQLGLTSRMTAITGVETTGHVPYLKIPNYIYPLVIGHYNFWPLRYDPSKPRNGGPFDELIEPGELFTRANALMTASPIFQLNHPWAAAEFGRDLGFPRAIKLDLRKDLPSSDDGTDGRGIYVRTPKGAQFANDAHHSQEVMNGSQNDTLIQYRYFWFYLLNQGHLHAGTANSDSHGLTDDTVGVPRNVIFTSTQAGPSFDIDKFNTAVKNGRVLGTSAPIIEATVDGLTGKKDYGLEPFKPNEASGKLKIRVTTAPWAPVSEVRVIVNGQVAKTIGGLPMPMDLYGTSVHVAYDGEVALSELLAGVTGDAWIVVEASRPLPVAEDLGGGLDNAKDGMPDTTDNNGDGKIDAADIAKGEDYGPITNIPTPPSDDPLYPFAIVTDNGFPYAFTNPFVLDRDGNGRFDAPGVKGGR